MIDFDILKKAELTIKTSSFPWGRVAAGLGAVGGGAYGLHQIPSHTVGVTDRPRLLPWYTHPQTQIEPETGNPRQLWPGMRFLVDGSPPSYVPQGIRAGSDHALGRAEYVERMGPARVRDNSPAPVSSTPETLAMPARVEPSTPTSSPSTVNRSPVTSRPSSTGSASIAHLLGLLAPTAIGAGLGGGIGAMSGEGAGRGAVIGAGTGGGAHLGALGGQRIGQAVGGDRGSLVGTLLGSVAGGVGGNLLSRAVAPKKKKPQIKTSSAVEPASSIRPAWADSPHFADMNAENARLTREALEARRQRLIANPPPTFGDVVGQEAGSTAARAVLGAGLGIIPGAIYGATQGGTGEGALRGTASGAGIGAGTGIGQLAGTLGGVTLGALAGRYLPNSVIAEGSPVRGALPAAGGIYGGLLGIPVGGYLGYKLIQKLLGPAGYAKKKQQIKTSVDKITTLLASVTNSR